MQAITHFTFSNFEEYAAFCKHMATYKPVEQEKEAERITPKETVAQTEPVESAKKPVEKVAKQAKKEEKPKVAEPEEKPVESAKAEEKAPEAVPPTGERLGTEPTYDNMKTAVLAVSQKYKSKKRAFEILGKFGYEKITPDMDTEHYEGIIAECQKALDAAE